MSAASALAPDFEHEFRSLQQEHERLVVENLEYMGVLSRYARALGLCSTLAVEPLLERIVEGLCLETRAQGGLLWITRDEDGLPLRLATVRGLVKPREEPEELSALEPPPGLEGLREGGAGAFVGPLRSGANHAGPQGEALYVRLRHGGRLLAVARLSDRLDAEGFDARDLAAAEHFAEGAALALANAIRFRALERRSLRDPRTQAYTPAFFDGVVANELEKAHRFGRHFSLLEVELVGLAAMREREGATAASAFLDDFAERLQQALRGTDLCAVDGDSRYRLLLAETDALGAASLKRRIRGLVEPLVAAEGYGEALPTLRLAAATFPNDGSRIEELKRCLTRRLDEERRSLARQLERECHSFAQSRLRLLREAGPVPPQLPEQAFRFVLEELRRRAHERGLLWICPGGALRGPVLQELGRLRGRNLRAEIVLLADEESEVLRSLPITCVPPRRTGTRAPFLVYLGEAPAYACLRERDGDDTPFFHSSDRVLVEHLAFQLQRDLGRGVSA